MDPVHSDLTSTRYSAVLHRRSPGCQVDVGQAHGEQVRQAEAAGGQRLLKHQTQQDATWMTRHTQTFPIMQLDTAFIGPFLSGK